MTISLFICRECDLPCIIIKNPLEPYFPENCPHGSPNECDWLEEEYEDMKLSDVWGATEEPERI